jgi:hypothetical protein
MKYMPQHIRDRAVGGFLDLIVRRARWIFHHALQQQRITEIALVLLELRARLGVIMVRAQALHRHVRLDAAADALFGVLDKLVDAGQDAVERTRTDQAHDPWNMDREMRLALGDIGKTERGERRRRRLGIPHRLDRGEFHLLIFGNRITRFVAEHDDAERGGEAETRGDRHRALREIEVASAQEIPRADRQHEHRTQHVAGADRVHELRLRDRIEHDRAEVGDLHAHRVEIELAADWILHPCIRDQDPQRGEVRADREQKRDDQMLDARKLVPAEKEEANERRFEEERHQSFDCERRAEDIADVMRVVGPVRAELEFHRDAGRDAHCEIDAEQNAPELRHAFPDFAPGHHIDRFHDREHPRKTERQRHEQEVVERSQRELQTRERDDGFIDHARSPAERDVVRSPRARYPVADAGGSR